MKVILASPGKLFNQFQTSRFLGQNQLVHHGCQKILISQVTAKEPWRIIN